MVRQFLLLALMCLAPALAAGSVTTIMSCDGPLSGDVKAVTDTDVVLVSGGKETSIPITDIRPRDVVRCSKKVLKPDDAAGWFKLGEFCAQNKLRNDAVEAWNVAIKLNPREYAKKAEKLFEQLKNAGESYDEEGNDIKKPAGKVSAAKALRMRVLEAGKTYEFPELSWAKRNKIDSAHYHIETNVPELTSKYVMYLAEQLYEFYGQRLQSAPRERLTLYIFATRKDFVAEAAKAGFPVAPNVGGFYTNHPSPKFCAIYLPWVVQGSMDSTSVLMHEGFHQFYHRTYNISEPTWLNEGMATYFENSFFDGEKITDALISPSRLRPLQEMLKSGKHDSLEQVFNCPHAAFKVEQYGEAWSFIYFMAWGQAEKAKRTDYQLRFARFLASIKGKKPDIAQFENATGLKLKALESEWMNFVLSLDPEDPFGGRGNPRK